MLNCVLTTQRFGEANQFVGDSFDSLGDFLVGDAFSVESLTGGKGEPRNNDATEIEHKTIGVRHYRHVARVTAGGAEEGELLAAFDQRGTRTRRIMMLAIPMTATAMMATAIQRRFMGAFRLFAEIMSNKKMGLTKKGQAA